MIDTARAIWCRLFHPDAVSRYGRAAIAAWNIRHPMTVHDDDAEWLRKQMDGRRVNYHGKICLGWVETERIERIASRLSKQAGK